MRDPGSRKKDLFAQKSSTIMDSISRFAWKKGTLVFAAAALCAALAGGLIQALATQLRLQAPVPAPAQIAAVVGTDSNDPCARLKRLERDICIAESMVGQAPAKLKVQRAASDARLANYAGERLARAEAVPATR